MLGNISLYKRITNKFRIEKNNSLDISKKTKMNKCTITIKGRNNLLKIDEGTSLRNVNIEIVGTNCSIQIGKNCLIGNNTYLSTKEDDIHIIIKDNCGLSRNIKIMTSDGHPIFSNNIRCNNPKSIIIEKNVWITDNVTILKGVNIGENSVVGINSTLTKSIPCNVIAAGNPATIIKNNITWEA